MGMSMSLCYRTSMRLGNQQRQLLRQLLNANQKHSEFPNASKGLEGMLMAHRLLQERGSIGILVGGLAQSVWNTRRTRAELATHKDVDVLVMTDDFNLTEPFEGGVDWWLPCTHRIDIANSAGSVSRNITWFQNGHNIALSFHVETVHCLEPGLHIMDPGLVATMRLLEAEASIDARVIVDGYEAVFEKFWETTKGLMGSCLPKFLSDAFAGHILSDKYGGSQSHMVMNHLDQETIVAIDKHIREQQ